ncbi:MAG: hypothetical protein M5U08_07295 [Burkholderiales bacterium]|nr:hypothetical protein [Burkholderiales bacterium]
MLEVARTTTRAAALSAQRIARWLRAAACMAAAAAPLAADAQVMAGGGIVHAPAARAPTWAIAARFGAVIPLNPRAPRQIYAPARSDWSMTVTRDADILPTCYRFGRCSVAEIYAYRDRPGLLDRRAPSPATPAPVPDLARWRVYPVPVAPTPEEHIRPEYRNASLPREAFKESGLPR